MAGAANAPGRGRDPGSALSFKADGSKFSRPIDTYDRPYQNTGVVVRRDRIHSMADTWLRLLRALRQANLRWYEDPKLAMFVLKKYTQQPDPDVLQKTYDFETNPPGFTRISRYPSRPSRHPRFSISDPSPGSGKSIAKRILRYNHIGPAGKISELKSGNPPHEDSQNPFWKFEKLV